MRLDDAKPVFIGASGATGNRFANGPVGFERAARRLNWRADQTFPVEALSTDSHT